MKIVVGVVGFLVFVAVLVFGARELALRNQPARAASTTAPPPRLAQPNDDDDDNAADDDNRAPPTPPPLPAMTVVKDGKPLELAGVRKKPLLLHLWASWCGPCRAELPELLSYGRAGPAEVLAVSVDDYWEPVVKYFNGKIPPEIAWDKQIILEKTLGVDGIPATFLVDEKGLVIDRFDGAHNWNAPELRQRVVDDLAAAKKLAGG